MSHLQCPSCGAEMNLDVAMANEALRRATFDLLQLSLPLGALVMRYVALFRPAKNRLSPDRMAKLVAQLVPDMQREAITHRGRDWPTPRDSWRAGFETMLEKAAAGKLTLPLDSHAYLYTVLVGTADRAEAAEEAAMEEQRRNRRETGAATPPRQVTEVVERKLGVPPHIREQLDAIKRGEPIQKGSTC
ncbi:hypothetical protein ACO2Q9_02725 [Variovorax sp. VNK109]|uniref:hypothetical protein n=1 Tax=Variovorax sp. VNK109 TaxID=3400919 RepID=UPI003BFB0C11